MPARMTEPAVGASTWASGNQVCTGHIGIFTAKEAKNASHAQVCRDFGTAVCINAGMSVMPEASQEAFSTNWKSGCVGSKRQTRISEIAKVTSVVHSAIQRELRRAA